MLVNNSIYQEFAERARDLLYPHVERIIIDENVTRILGIEYYTVDVVLKSGGSIEGVYALPERLTRENFEEQMARAIGYIQGVVIYSKKIFL